MTLGMIWTIILRFAIQDISVEGKTSRGFNLHKRIKEPEQCLAEEHGGSSTLQAAIS